jgi:hypothetical protein
MSDLTRQARPRDHRFVDALQRRFGGSLGFLPTPAIAAYLERGHVRIALENGDPAGYLLGSPRLRWQPLLRPIYQACVAMDAQRRHHGLQLLKDVEAAALTAGQIGIQANCAVGLEANEFWLAAGFKPIAILTPQNARNREIICWRKPLVTRLPLWFANPPDRAGHKAQNPRLVRNPRKDHRHVEEAKRLTLRDQAA